MRSWVCLCGLIVAVLLVNLVAVNEVTAAPEPCAFWDHHHYHYQETTAMAPTEPTQSTEEPKDSEDKEKNDKKEKRKERFKILERLLGDWWMSWGQSWEMQESDNSSYMEGFVKSYLELLAYLFNVF